MKGNNMREEKFEKEIKTKEKDLNELRKVLKESRKQCKMLELWLKSKKSNH